MNRAIGIGVAGLGFFSGYFIANRTSNPKALPDRFDVLAKKYDEEIGASEKAYRLDESRRKMIGKAQGRVLEVCAGTGRNLPYYTNLVSELILVDASKEMLQEAVKKRPSGLSSMKVMQASDLSYFPDNSFDTIVDTFGICSVDEPVKYLKDVKRVLKPGGQALFLEHGRVEPIDGSVGIVGLLVNKWLDFRAGSHADYWGCVWNREIVAVVQEAGFSIVDKEIQHAGTCTEIHATRKLS